MSDFDRPEYIRAEVLAANAEINAEAIAARPVNNLVKPPARPDPTLADEKRIDRAYSLEQYGEAELIKFFFAGLYTRNNLASPPNSAGIFEDMHEWTGAYWQRDTDHKFKADLFIVGQAFHLRAWSFYDRAAREHFLPQPPAPLAPDSTQPSGKNPAKDSSPAPGPPPPEAEPPPKYELAALKARAKVKDKDFPPPPELVVLVKKGDEYMARAHRCWTLPRQTQAAALACSGQGSLGFSGVWNAHPYLLPCPNGTLDLTTGEFMKPRPEHYFNRCVPHNYVGPGVDCPTWTDLLEKCLGHNKALLEYFELVLGSCLIGHAPKNIFLAYGPGANNGKSTLFGALARLLGEFAVEMGPDLFLSQPRRNSDAPRPGLLRLESARVAILSEADARDWFDLGQIKSLTGGDKVSERTLNNALYRNFRLEATFFLHSNHIPQTAGLDRGFQDRLVVLPFLARYLTPDKLAKAQKDGEPNVFPVESRTELDRRLDLEMPGILARLVASARKLLAMGCRLPPPPPISVEYASNYLYDQDLVGQFIEARCLLGSAYKASAKNLYKAFKEWCTEEHDMETRKVPSQQAFGRGLHARIRDRKRDSHGWTYEGIALNGKEDYGSLAF